MSNQIAVKVASYLKYQRKKQDLTLAQLAEKTNLTASFLNRLEQAEYQDVKFGVIEKLATAFHMSVIDFLVKCQLIQHNGQLPELEFYLKEKFQFPREAVEEITMFVEFMKKKYRQHIKQQLKQHQKYWESETQN